MKKNSTLLLLLFSALCSINTSAQNWNQIIKVAAGDRENKTSAARTASDNFGYSVAIDGNYAIVGAYQEDEDSAGINTLSDAGAAYILFNNAGTWVQVKKITASIRAASDNFGYSVSISGDYAIIGAYLEDQDALEANTLSSSGSAYIFKKDQGGANNWGQVKKITASTREASDLFGWSVAISGDYAIIGAPYESEDATEANTIANSGSAYIFKKDQGGMDNWGQVKKITASTRATSDNFGYSVSISGDYAIVGAYSEDEDAAEANTLTDAGSAYIFKKDQGGVDNWGYVKKITASTRAASDFFGWSVAISADYAIVGADLEDEDDAEANTLSASGSAYIFKKDQGSVDNWGLVKKITASTRAASDKFGYSVAISGDYVLVGAYQEDEDAAEVNTLNNSGSSYVFKKDQGGIDNWGLVKKITASTRATSDNFGNSVAISGSYVLAGAYNEDEDAAESNTVFNSGSAYIFKNDQGGTDNWGQTQKTVMQDRTQNDSYGYSVAIDGNYAIVGGLYEDEDSAGINTLSNAGAAYILFNNAGSWAQIKKITASTRGRSDLFGWPVAISGDYAIIGAPYESEDAAEANTLAYSGSAYIFKKDQGGVDNWGQVKKITASTRGGNDLFGISVAISGDYAIVGAYNEDDDTSETNTMTDAGSAYIFKKDQGGLDNWGQVKKITASTRAVNDYFGVSVDISGDFAIVGAYNEDDDTSETNTLTDAGSAYIFKKDQGGLDNWGQVKKITASTRAASDFFGISVAISGDYVLVGANAEDEDAAEANTLTNSGSAYIFKKDQGGVDNWGQVKKITASTRAASDFFGWSVAISGDYAIIGADNEDEDALEANTLSNSGSACIFKKDQGGADNWGQVKKITASTRAAADFFGVSVAISGDYAIVGACEEDEGAAEANTLTDAGSAYIFFNCTTPAITSQPANNTICAGSNASYSVTASGSILTYQWQEDNGGGFSNLNNIGIYSNVTTSTLNITGATASMNTYQYRCVVNGACSPDVTSNAEPLIVTIIPGITGTTSASRCDAGTLVLGATASAGILNWYAASSGGTLLGTGTSYTTPGISTTTLYYADATDNGCSSARISVIATVNNSTAGTLTETACGSYSLNAQSYTTGGTYLQTLTNAIGCDSALTLNLTIITIDASVLQSGNILTANASGVAYQWIDCDNGNTSILNETNQSYAAMANGNYAVIITNTPCSDTSVCYNVNALGVAENNFANTISISPNPTNGVFIIQMKSGQIEVYNVLGECILKSLIVNPTTLIDLSSHPAGIYFLHLKNPNEMVVRKMVKE